MHPLNRRRFFSAALGAWPAATIALAQEDPPTFSVDSRLVVLHATVVNNKGQLVTTLPGNAFKVYENNVEQPIKAVRREDVPVALGVIVDNSGSMRDKRAKVEAASVAMVKASNRLDRVFVVNFNDEAYRDVDFTSDVKKMEEGIARIDSRGGTAFFDALSASIDYVRQYGRLDKKVLMLVTDGADNASTSTLEKLLPKVHDSGVVVHVIGLLSQEEPREAKRAQRALKMIADASGGLCFFPKELAEVETLALQVAHDIRNQYVIQYSPVNQNLDGSFRAIKVTANGPNKPSVRTRSGYYATAARQEPKKLSQATP